MKKKEEVTKWHTWFLVWKFISLFLPGIIHFIVLNSPFHFYYCFSKPWLSLFLFFICSSSVRHAFLLSKLLQCVNSSDLYLLPRLFFILCGILGGKFDPNFMEKKRHPYYLYLYLYFMLSKSILSSILMNSDLQIHITNRHLTNNASKCQSLTSCPPQY